MYRKEILNVLVFWIDNELKKLNINKNIIIKIGM